MSKRFDELVKCIAGNDAFRVGALLSEDPDMVKARDAEGRTPILLALYFRHEALAEMIRERHPAPDLFEAAALGDTELVARALEEHGDGANAVAPDGFGVLGLAAYFGRPQTAELLLSSGADPDRPSANDYQVRPLHSAAAHRDPETSLSLVRILLDGGADPNVAQAGGWTPLHQAAAHGREAVVRLLMDRGASLTAKSEDGRTPLEMARAKGHPGLESLLGG